MPLVAMGLVIYWVSTTPLRFVCLYGPLFEPWLFGGRRIVAPIPMTASAAAAIGRMLMNCLGLAVCRSPVTSAVRTAMA